MENNEFYLKQSYSGLIVNTNTTNYGLNVQKIKSLDDIKRVLEFLHITVALQDGIEPRGYNNVKDLFE